jgi:hypothetical protein
MPELVLEKGDTGVSLDYTTERPGRSMLCVGAGLAALLCCACGFPPERLVTGVLTKIERRQDLESVCHLVIRAKDANACHEPPVCCSYKLTVRDTTGRQEFFYAFWPDYAPGLKWMELRLISFHLHRQEIVEFPCTLYGCRSFLDYALQSDDDWRVLQ